ncbi:hypothetical protein [Paraburkholderia hospita]|uniref:hypothetical protein n=1 Tax=Paraburkholderia hospita TaxID=169430 RepID=UPI000271B66A|nr:hypothetical protein [Paraburkholderia hospita]EUC12352.1 Dyp-type peroxidase [Burkholderia sp. BT03]SKC51959.1 hypothetical protein SAMN06266956_0476 [Paraburkholderia hospita]
MEARYSAPAGADDAGRGSDPDALRNGWHNKVSGFIALAKTQSAFFYEQLADSPDIPDSAPTLVPWSAYPKWITTVFDDFAGPPDEAPADAFAETLEPAGLYARTPTGKFDLSQWSTRIWDEYCEWATVRENNSIVAMQFAAEPPEYWETLFDEDPKLVVTLYCELLRTNAVQESDLRGAKLPGDIEHFGFRDGVSQVGPRGKIPAADNEFLTPRYFAEEDPAGLTMEKPGQPLLGPCQFVFGYPYSDPDNLTVPGKPTEGGECWMQNGSFLIYRRLRQDVAAFDVFDNYAAADLTTRLGRPVSGLEAKSLLVGSWPDGTPVLSSPQSPDPVAADDLRVNNFDYHVEVPALRVVGGTSSRELPSVSADPAGQRCPRFAHIRKVNPRDMPTDHAGLRATFQMLRRSIPFGPLYADDPSAERGLLFLAYMTSVELQFRLLTVQWMNNFSAPEANEPGHDMLVGRADSGQARHCTLKDAPGNPRVQLETTDRWVIPAGGLVLFSPAINLLASI